MYYTRIECVALAVHESQDKRDKTVSLCSLFMAPFRLSFVLSRDDVAIIQWRMLPVDVRAERASEQVNGKRIRWNRSEGKAAE